MRLGHIDSFEVRPLKKGNLLTLCFASIGMLVLILDGKTAISGIQRGIDICLRTLIPSLFPFFVLSGMITGSVIGHTVAPLRLIGKICRIPAGSESLLAVGFLGGYPIGAKNVSDAYTRNQLTREDALRMAVFCNNAGPSFIFGVLGPLFSDMRWVWMLWLIQIVSAVITGILIPGEGSGKTVLSAQEAVTLPDTLYGAVKSMAMVSGWVILFRMLLEFLNRWILWILPSPAQVLFTGFLELANGCIRLQEIENEPLRFLFASILLSMGGICIWMQTKSVFRDMHSKTYFFGKLLQSLVSLCLSAAAVPLLCESVQFSPIFAFGFVSVLILIPALNAGKRKKEVAIQ